MKQSTLFYWFKEYYENTTMRHISDMDAFEMVFLGALVNAGLDEEEGYMRSLNEITDLVSPIKGLTEEIINLLLEKEFILCSNLTDIKTMNVTEDGSLSYKFNDMKWKLNIYHHELERGKLLEKIIAGDLFELDSNEISKIWRGIATCEVIQYFEYSVGAILNWEFVSGNKTKKMIAGMLDNFSVAQIHSIIYKSTNDVLRRKVEYGMSRKHSSNMVVTFADNYANRALANRWEIRSSYRSKECPQSILSMYFFNKVARLGDKGFNSVPLKSE